MRGATGTKLSVRWPLLTIAAGLVLMHFGGRFFFRLTSRWKELHPDVTHPFTDEWGSAFRRENPVAWLLPILSFVSLGLVLGGLLWLALAAAF